ncbi:MAG: hypothetical protein ACPGQL_03065 [Thermoplasmatota archaeon]
MKTKALLAIALLATTAITVAPPAAAHHHCDSPFSDVRYLCYYLVHDPWRVVCDQIKKYVGPDLCWLVPSLTDGAHLAELELIQSPIEGSSPQG